MNTLKHYSIRVSGKVQGVFFRATTQKVAIGLGITGWVRNEPNGTVKIEAEGSEEQLNEFLEFCRKGPERSVVDNMDYEERPLEDFKGFEIK
jgi:acylphosphatase